MHVIVEEDLIDKKFIEERTEGFESFRESLKHITPEEGERITGVPKEKIIKAALLYGNACDPAFITPWGLPSIHMAQKMSLQ